MASYITKVTYDSLNNYFIDFANGDSFNSHMPCLPDAKYRYNKIVINLIEADLAKGISINDMVYVPNDLDEGLCKIKTIVSYYENGKILTQHYYLENNIGEPLSLMDSDIETIPQRRNNLINDILK